MITDFIIALICYDVFKFFISIIWVMIHKDKAKEEYKKQDFQSKLRAMMDDSNKNKEN